MRKQDQRMGKDEPKAKINKIPIQQKSPRTLALNRIWRLDLPIQKPRWIAFGVTASQLPLYVRVIPSCLKILVTCCQQACIPLKSIKAAFLCILQTVSKLWENENIGRQEFWVLVTKTWSRLLRGLGILGKNIFVGPWFSRL